MPRKLILDIETTGLNFNNDDRIIEICCAEIINYKITDNMFHSYINPKKLISKEAYLIHGLNNDFLKDKPLFSDIVNDFLNFISNSEIIVHNSQFDINFINMELRKLNYNNFLNYCLKITDTLILARKLYPRKKNSLDALCKRFNINLKNRKLHGAVLDVKLLSKVYSIMTKSQEKLIYKKNNYIIKKDNVSNNLVLKANKDELKSHYNFIDELK